jgi:hypothetical protein
MGYAVIQLLLTLYVPARFAGILPILFAVGAVTYAAHPEGIVEYQKSRWMARVSKAFALYDARRARKSGSPFGETRGPMDGLREALPAVSMPLGKRFGG